MTGRWRSATAGLWKPAGTLTGSLTSRSTNAVADPIGQVSRVYQAVGLTLTVEAEGAMVRWLDERPREAARPAYGLENYGLRPEQVDDRFALYNKRFRSDAQK